MRLAHPCSDKTRLYRSPLVQTGQELNGLHGSACRALRASTLTPHGPENPRSALQENRVLPKLIELFKNNFFCAGAVEAQRDCHDVFIIPLTDTALTGYIYPGPFVVCLGVLQQSVR